MQKHQDISESQEPEYAQSVQQESQNTASFAEYFHCLLYFEWGVWISVTPD